MADVPATRPSLLARLRAGLMGIGPWSSRPGPLSGPAAYTDEGWIPLSWPSNFGQLGYDPIPGGYNSVVYACIMLYARTIAQLPGFHKRHRDDNGVDIVTNSALSRILKMPNDYQTRSDFLLNMVIALLGEGNAYALALRNNRFEVSELHQFPSRSCRPMVAPTGEIFYSIGGNPVMDYRLDPAFENGARWIVPARDILHLRGPANPRNPLVGESPLIAGGLPVAMNSGGAAHYARFFQNMSRPSGVLKTDLTLTAEQIEMLRAKWLEHSRGLAIGGVPVLSAGLKWEQLGITAQDAQIAESMKMSVADIARLFGVPLALINDMTGATWANTEQLIIMWLRQGLGYYLDMIELCFDKLFQQETAVDFTEFDIDALLRPDFKSRIEGLKNAVQGGIYAPNEARKVEELKWVENGDEPRVQQQQVPLSWGGFTFQPPAPTPPGSNAASADPAANDNAGDGGGDGTAAAADDAAAKAARIAVAKAAVLREVVRP